MCRIVKRSRVELFTLMVLLGLCSDVGAQDNLGEIDVKELISNKDKYDGERVRVKGYVRFGFEGCILLPDDPKKDSYSREYRIWYWSEACMTNTGDPKYGYAVVEGVFDKDDKGFLWSYSSAILNSNVEWVGDSDPKLERGTLVPDLEAAKVPPEHPDSNTHIPR